MIDGTFIYAEFDNKEGPVIRAYYSPPGKDLLDEEIRRVKLFSIPQMGQIGEVYESGLFVFVVSEDKICISVYRYLSGKVRTLTGASLASLSFVTEQTINPFRLKPFLESLMRPLFRIVVNNEILKQIYEAIQASTDGKIYVENKKAKVPVRITARLPALSEIPDSYWLLNEQSRELGK